MLTVNINFFNKMSFNIFYAWIGHTICKQAIVIKCELFVFLHLFLENAVVQIQQRPEERD